MKKFALVLAAALMVGGSLFAQEDKGALGFGIMSESSSTSFGAKNFRGSLFLDVGAKLFGPVSYGFEFQFDGKLLSQKSEDYRKQDWTIFGFGDGDYALFVQTSKVNVTTKLWDLDFSPRGYLSFDLGDKLQLLGFLGLNYNWQTIDYKLKVNQGSWTKEGKTYTANTDQDTYENSTSLDGNWDAVAGLRLSVGAFYVDYTRFLRPDDAGNYSFNQSNKNRLGIGVSLRF